MVLGGGPNRIGQGIEFDYCCVHAAIALREAGYEAIMVNCNPETVSTDYDTSDRLYFEPLTLEDVLAIVEIEQPKGVIVQYGGQTPLKLAQALQDAGVPIVGAQPDAIDLVEDRERFQQLITELGLLQPPNRTARQADEALILAREIGYPLVVRPSYVLGGRAMEIVYGEADLKRYGTEAVKVSNDSPVLPLARQLLDRGFALVATTGTWRAIVAAGIACEQINKVIQGRPHIVDLIKNDDIQLIINTTEGRQAIRDSFSIRRQALNHKVNYSTTIAAAGATLHALDYLGKTKVNSLQDLHRELER